MSAIPVLIYFESPDIGIIADGAFIRLRYTKRSSLVNKIQVKILDSNENPLYESDDIDVSSQLVDETKEYDILLKRVPGSTIYPTTAIPNYYKSYTNVAQSDDLTVNAGNVVLAAGKKTSADRLQIVDAGTLGVLEEAPLQDADADGIYAVALMWIADVDRTIRVKTSSGDPLLSMVVAVYNSLDTLMQGAMDVYIEVIEKA